MKPIWLNNKRVNFDTVRLKVHYELQQCMIKYAEYMGGDPVDEADLIELDELMKDWIFEQWLEVTDNVVPIRRRST